MYPEEFIIEMSQLPYSKQCLFGLSQAERIIHFYKAFEEEWEVDQPYEVMINALDAGYEYITSPSTSQRSYLNSLLIEVEKGIPDPDEYRGGTEVVYGQNAALSLFCSLKFMKTKELSVLEDAISKTIDTVDGVTLDKIGDEEYDTQPNIEQEIGLQLDFMEFINNMNITPESVNALRSLSRQRAISV